MSIFRDGACESVCFVLDVLNWALCNSWWATALWECCFGRTSSETGAAFALMGQSVQIHVRINHNLCYWSCLSFIVDIFLDRFSLV